MSCASRTSRGAGGRCRGHRSRWRRARRRAGPRAPTAQTRRATRAGPGGRHARADASSKAAGEQVPAARSPARWGEAAARGRGRAARCEQRAVATTVRRSSTFGPARGRQYALIDVPHGVREQGRAVETVTLEVGADYAWHVIGDGIAVTRRATCRNRRAVEVRLPRLRRGGELESGKQKLVCPFCGTESPAKLDAARRNRRARPRRALRGVAIPAAAGRAAPGQVPELQRDLGARSRAAGAELRILRLGAARPVRRRRSRPSVPKACCRFEVSETQARDGIRALVRQACGSRRSR